jgi:hypothetical protein
MKMGRTSSVHPGQIAGAGEPLLALKMPAVKLPWVQAALPEWAHPARGSPAASLTLSAARSGWFAAMGPSINPIAISPLPLLSSISGARLTKFKKST